MKNGLTFKTTKKYPRVTAGPLRHKYVHRIVAAALIGRELTKDEEVHHKDGNRLNFNWDNLMVLGSKDHGWVSSKQNWYMKEHDFLLKQQWDDYMDEEYKRFDADVALAKANGVPYNVDDGQMRERFEGVENASL
jgi:hypothetical protein